METFKIKYDGQDVPVEKDRNGNYVVILPEVKNAKGAEFCQRISNHPDGWRYTMYLKELPQIYSHIWLKHNGHMAYSTFKEPKPIESEEKFDPDSNKSGNVLNVCQKIYDVGRQIFVYEKLGMAPYEILSLRQEVLDTALTLLGTLNKETPSFFVLGKTGKRLEEYVNFALYLRKVKSADGKNGFEYKIPEDLSKEKFLELVGKTRTRLAEDKKFIEVRSGQLQGQRDFLADYGEDGYTDYCIDISKSSMVRPEESLLYNKVVSNISDLYRALNSDLIPYSHSSRIPNAITLTGLELSDKISEIVDSRAFQKACEIESRFVIGEAKRFLEFINKNIRENERATTTLIELKKNALSTISEREQQDSSRNEMLNSHLNTKRKTNETLNDGEVSYE